MCSSSDNYDDDSYYPMDLGPLRGIQLKPLGLELENSDSSSFQSDTNLGVDSSVRAVCLEAGALDGRVHHASDHVVPAVGFAHSTPVMGPFSQVRSPVVSPIHSLVGGYCVELGGFKFTFGQF